MDKYGLISLVLICGMVLAVVFRKLTVAGSFLGGIIGFLVYCGSAYTGIIMMAAFFVMATLATAWKGREKSLHHLNERDSGRRNAGQVMANAGIAGTAGLLAFLFPLHDLLFRLMIAAAFASAAADTVSSEVGNVYGKRYYNILTWKPDKRGANGVISVAGTIAGLAGSVIIAIIYCSGFGWSADFLWIIAAGTVGNFFDSVLGATVERRGYIGNDMVNFLNTLVAASVMLLR
jgi:uncharacterized protein (TIGR00297 family)